MGRIMITEERRKAPAFAKGIPVGYAWGYKA
jgi:hypothetical protein